MALRSGDFVLFLRAGCIAIGGRMVNFQRLVCAMGEWDAGVAGGDPCVLREIRKEQCRNLGGVVVVRSAVAAKMEPFARYRPKPIMHKRYHIPDIVTFVCGR